MLLKIPHAIRVWVSKDRLKINPPHNKVIWNSFEWTPQSNKVLSNKSQRNAYSNSSSTAPGKGSSISTWFRNDATPLTFCTKNESLDFQSSTYISAIWLDLSSYSGFRALGSSTFALQACQIGSLSHLDRFGRPFHCFLAWTSLEIACCLTLQWKSEKLIRRWNQIKLTFLGFRTSQTSILSDMPLTSSFFCFFFGDRKLLSSNWTESSSCFTSCGRLFIWKVRLWLG